MKLLSEFNLDPTILETLVYRGHNIRFNWDTQGQFVYTTDWPQFDNSPVLAFGRHNWDFREDMKLVIDTKQDLIYQYQPNSGYKGAKWVYFNNRGYRDARLLYNLREIAVIPITQISKLPELPELQKLGIQLLSKYIDC